MWKRYQRLLLAGHLAPSPAVEAAVKPEAESVTSGAAEVSTRPPRGLIARERPPRATIGYEDVKARFGR
jgi:hypothetical protein